MILSYITVINHQVYTKIMADSKSESSPQIIRHMPYAKCELKQNVNMAEPSSCEERELKVHNNEQKKHI